MEPPCRKKTTPAPQFWSEQFHVRNFFPNLRILKPSISLQKFPINLLSIYFYSHFPCFSNPNLRSTLIQTLGFSSYFSPLPSANQTAGE